MCKGLGSYITLFNLQDLTCANISCPCYTFIETHQAYYYLVTDVTNLPINFR